MILAYFFSTTGIPHITDSGVFASYIRLCTISQRYGIFIGSTGIIEMFSAYFVLAGMCNDSGSRENRMFYREKVSHKKTDFSKIGQ